MKHKQKQCFPEGSDSTVNSVTTTAWNTSLTLLKHPFASATKLDTFQRRRTDTYSME